LAIHLGAEDVSDNSKGIMKQAIRDAERFEQLALAAAVMEAHNILSRGHISNSAHIFKQFVKFIRDEGGSPVRAAPFHSSCDILR